MSKLTLVNPKTTFENYLNTQIDRMAVLQFHLMQKKNYYGELGEQRVMLTYCRQLLDIPAHIEVNQNHADEFQEMMAEKQKEFEKYSLKELEKMEEDMKCTLPDGRVVEWFKEDEINKVLEEIGSENRIIVGFLGQFRSVIYGQAKVTFLDEYRVTEFIKEIKRTPAAVLSIAAVVGGRHVCLRHEACYTIFANKWRRVFEMEDWEKEILKMDDYDALAESFKEKAMAGYGFKNMKDLEKGTPLFIEEMLEGLIWHEVGHGIVLNSLIKTEESAFGEALAVLGNNIISVMKEFLADWAPARPHQLDPVLLKEKILKQKPGYEFKPKEDLRWIMPEEEFKKESRAFLVEGQDAQAVGNHIRGPLRHILNIAGSGGSSSTGYKKATRMLHVYLSDNWFLGNDTENFGNHTDLMLAYLIPFLKPKAQFDFEAWSQKLPEYFNEVLSEYLRVVKNLENRVLKATFDYENQKMTFAQYSPYIKKKVHEQESGLEEDSMEFMVPFFAEILEKLHETNPPLLKEIKKELEIENEKFHKALLKKLGQKGDDFDSLAIRKLLIESLKKSGY